MKKRISALLLALTLVSGSLSACFGRSDTGSAAAETAAAGTAAASEAAAPADEESAGSGQSVQETGEGGGAEASEAEAGSGAEKHINAGLYWFGTNLDPVCEYNAWTLTRTGTAENLVCLNENLEIVGQIADSWEMPDENTWVFHIRDGVTFHDGSVCDAAAVKASFGRALENSARAQTSTYISGIEADGSTITFTTSQPNSSFLNAVSEPLFAIEKVGEDIDYENAPVCTGPFMITGYEADVRIETARYENYWGGASDVATMTIVNVSDDSTRAMALQSGELDIVQRISASDLSLFTDNPDYTVADTVGIRTRHLQFNFENALLQDLNVRTALMACLDYDALARVLGSNTRHAGALFPLDIYGYQTVPVQAYDPEAAAAALADSGYADSDGDGYVDRDGVNLELTLTYDVSTMTSVNEAIQSMAAAAGIKLNLNLVESIDDIEINGDFEIKQRNVQYLSTGDPAWVLTSGYHSASETNYGHYSNAELDALIDEIAGTFDQEKKAELVTEAQRLLLTDVAGIYLMSQSNIVAANAKVQNISAHPIDYYFITNELTISE